MSPTRFDGGAARRAAPAPSDGCDAPQALLKAGALQRAILNSANFSSIATDATGVIQIFNTGAERMLGYTSAEVVNAVTPADISDPQELIARANALSVELATAITPGFEALVFKASRGIEDIYELTYIRKDGSRFPAVVSVTALRDADDAIIGYLLIGTDNTARKQAEEALLKAGALQRAIFNSANFSSIATDAKGVIQIFNVGAERMLGYAAIDVMNKVTPADISDPQELIARAKALSVELETAITPGFEALVFKASRGIEDIYELTYIRKDGSRFPAVVSVTALRDAEDGIIGYLLIGTDNTARSETAAQVRLQSAALNAAANAIVITDRAGLIQWINPAFSELTGYAAPEVVGRNPRDLVKSNHHQPVFYEQLWDTITSGRVWRGETINRRKDGSLYTEEQTITPVRDLQGEICHFIAIKQDITGRKLAERELRESEARLNEAQHMAHIGNWRLVPGGPLIVSDEMYELHRLPRDVPPSFEALTANVHPDDRKSRAALEAVVASDLLEFRSEYRVVWPDGQVRHMLAAGSINRDAGGRLLDVVGTVQDVTERALAAEALRTAEERMRFALQNANVGIWDLDYATGVLRASAMFEAHLGLPPGTFGGTVDALVQCMHPLDRDAMRETIAEALRSGADFSAQFRTLRPDGTIGWLNGIGRVQLGEHGEPVRGVGISLDVTARHTLEEQFQQAQKMEAVGRLAGGVAHDFNNLLTAILGYCELLLEDIGQGDPRGADIRQIQGAGMRAAGLTRQLLAFSRKQIIEPALLDLNAIVADIQGMLGRLIGEDVTIVVALRPDLAQVKADRSQVEQVIMNLAVNARDAMPKGGTLTIETGHVELDEHYVTTHLDVKPGPYVLLAVTDTGTGMTPAVQARLFEPFFTTKEPGKGTGLGMATVYGIVTGSGGSIGVYSELGEGTAFKVYFPRADAAPMAVPPAAPAARPRSGSQTVLVVEDETGLRELAQRLLQRLGYTVLTAADAAEARRVCEEHPAIDLLLTDVVMPGASGPELTIQLIEQRPALKVIYMSGYTEDAIVQHGVLKPGIAFLNKPFTSQTLGQKIREVLDR